MDKHLTTRDAASAAVALVTYLDFAEPGDWDALYFDTVEEIGAHDLVSALTGLAAGLLDIMPDNRGRDVLQALGANVETLPPTPLYEEDEA